MSMTKASPSPWGCASGSEARRRRPPIPCGVPQRRLGPSPRPGAPRTARRIRERASMTIEVVRGWINEASRVIALTGAGMSTESGIPDFRGPQGVWTRDPRAERLSDIRHYMTDPEVRRLSWRSRLVHPAWTAEPNAGHLALVALERRGRLHGLITQNIDGLHQ